MLPEHLGALPAGFVFGTATAAYQIEGGVDEGGRGPSIWDTFSHTPGTTHDGDTGDVACDHFHRWRADLDLMVELGLPAYRLSLSWSRLQPTGDGPLNPEGVAFYRDLLEGCRARGIEPFVTLYHWDLPQALQERGGWPGRATAERFGAYAGMVFDELGDLFTNVITINEPWCAAFLGHDWGMQAPGWTDPTAATRALHHLLLAHGLAQAEARRRAPHVAVGITNILSKVAPATDSPADVDAARVLDIRNNRITLEPCYLGEYSDEVRQVFGPLGLDETLVLDGDLELISASADFVGVNHYHNMVVSADETQPGGIAMSAAEPATTSWGWSVTPDALHEIVTRVARDFSSLPIYITENGATYDEVGPDGEVDDLERIDYLRGYIDAVARAVADGVDVRGYFAWSFLDNFEWAEGYDKRFGLVFVDFGTQARIPKASAHWYRDLIAAQLEGAT